MARTFDEANEDVGERREQAEERAREVVEEIQSRNLRGRDFSKMFEAFGPFGGDVQEEIQERREETAEDFDNNISISIEEELGVDFDELLGRVGEINELDLSELNQQELLALIAEQMNQMVVNLVKLADQNSGLAALLNDIASSVQVPFGISVTGVNDINDANVPQPVVRGSDDNPVNARVFKLRASTENTAPIWLGDEDVEVGQGTKLGIGETFPMELDLTQDQLYMISEKEAQEIEIIGLV